MKRILTLVAVFFAAGVVLAQTRPVPGTEYQSITPAQRTSGTKIEVLEFFSYACPHCYNFEPVLKNWVGKKPADVEFRYVPAVFNQNMLPLAKLHYALEEMDLLPALHEKVYAAIHDKGINLFDRAAIVKWIGEQGTDAKKFEAVFDSFSVGTKAQRAAQMTRAYRISATPTVAVNGKYLTAPSMTLNASGGMDVSRFVQVLNSLIDMERRKT